ncbi:FumA C-terminus/TtdB family hydratase beta subunit [Candidatus Woesearchaeota archaeon]|nr:FumA C-terminus/TtdB family hydratase beta subunit [Candidatus Woesearchaeota archaeon]
MAVKLTFPIEKEEIRKLKVGDIVSLSGIIYTARDAAHKYFFEKKPKEFVNKLADSAIYHCGPIVKKKGKKYSIVSAGPTTSIREEPYEWKIIRAYKVRAIIGKGGMGMKTQEACKKYGCIYLSAVGGAAALLAKTIKNVMNVYKLEFGMPEAIWELDVKDFPAIVTMDSKGRSLHKE